MSKTILSPRDGEAISNQAGFTLVEALVTALIVAIVSLIVAEISGSSSNYFKRLLDKKSQERQMISMLNKMRADITKFEIIFDADETMENLYASKDDFPFYWSNKIDYVKKEECIHEIYKDKVIDCPLEGRMAYLIQPVADMTGLYKATVYSYHRSLSLSDNDFKKMTIFIRDN